MNQLINSMTVLVSAIIGVAILSVIVSRNANTSGVISSSAQGFASMLGAAEAPVTGGGVSMGNSGFSQQPMLNLGSFQF